MQRYRVNLPLLIGLLVGAILILGAGFALWQVQLRNSAVRMKERAVQLEAEGGIENLREAAGLLRKYVEIHRDDEEAADKMANVYADITDEDEAERLDFRNALSILESTVRNQPTNAPLRRRLVELSMQTGRTKDAIEHITLLLNASPDDTELMAQRATCLFSARNDAKTLDYLYDLVGYDKAEDVFHPDNAKAPGETSVYRQLATIITRTGADPRIAERAMDQLVDLNPDSADARLARGQYRMGLKDEAIQEEGRKDLQKALELDENNAGAILANVAILTEDQEDSQIEEARALLEAGLKQHPENPRMYRSLASLQLNEKNYEGAIKELERGISALPARQASSLLAYQVRLQIQQGDIPAAEKSIAQMKSMRGFPKAFLDYLDARVMMSNQNWFKAAQQMERIKPSIMSDYELRIELGMMLGICHEQLGQFEKALSAYKDVLQANSDHAPAELGRVRCWRKLNPSRYASEENENDLNAVIFRELQKPEETQDWDEVFRLVNRYADEVGLSESAVLLIKADTLVRRGQYAEARKLTKEAITLSPDNIGSWRMAVKLTAADPSQGVVKAMERLDQVVEKFGDQPILRLDRADLFISLDDEDMTNQILSVTEGMDDLSTREQVQVWRGLAQKFAQLNDRESRSLCLNQVAELAPNELATILDLFLTARQENNDARMSAAQEKILKVVGNKENPNWLFAEANRLISLRQRDLAGKEVLSEAADLINRALVGRPEWHQLHLLKAEIALLKGDQPAALASLDRASELGPVNPIFLIRHVSLLAQRGRYVDARKQLERVDKVVRQRLLGRQYTEILYNTGAVAQSLESADEMIQLAEDSGPMQLWYGNYLVQAARSPKLTDSQREEVRNKAGKALARAVELTPKSQQAWLALVTYFAAAQQMEEAQQAVQKAQLALDEGDVMLVLARGYEMLGRWFDAENAYKRAIEQTPNDLESMRRLITFYLGQGYPRKDKQQKATQLINTVLRVAAENPELNSNANVLWARRIAAEILASTKDYQNILKAERLLASNVVNGDLSEEDKILLAKILSSRPEPVSRVKAARLLENARQNRVLTPDLELALGKLYFSIGDWPQCRQQMQEVISRSPDMLGARISYIHMLLQHDGIGDLSEATRHLKRLRDKAPTLPATLDLLVRVSTKAGKEREVKSALQRILGDVNKADYSTIVQIAQTLAEMDDLDMAEKLFRFAVTKNGAGALLLADFLGRKRNPEDAFDLLEKLRETVGDEVCIERGLAILRARRDEIGNDYDEPIEKWLGRALRENPESIPILLKQAEFFDIQQRYEEAIAVYRTLLSRDDLEGFGRAIVLNNLAYLLANTSEGSLAQEAMDYVGEAIEILGPNSDILDTRAVVLIALEQYDEAIADLELSVIDTPTGSKFFHKSHAHFLAGQPDQALDSWDRAVEMGLEREDLSPVEREHYDELKAKINRARPETEPL